MAKKDKSKKSKKKKIIIGLIIAAAVGGLGFGGYKLRAGGQTNDFEGMDDFMMTAPVMYGNIENKITGSAPVSPADAYSVKSLVSGSIDFGDFNEGDRVDKDQVLYQVDDSSSDSGMTTAKNQLEQAMKSYNKVLENTEKLLVKAPIDGAVVSMDLEKGVYISAGQELAKVENRQVMKLKLPFLKDEALGFYVGQTGEVVLEGSFEILTGSVTHISGLDEVAKGNRIVRMVTIEVNNPGALSEDLAASARIDGKSSSEYGTLAYKETASVTADIGGKIEEILIEVGDVLREDAPVVRLSSEDLDDSLETAQDSIETARESVEHQEEQLDNYTIKSPIAGTIVEKTVKAGDNIESGADLCTIYDMSYLTFKLNIDEADIRNVALGQKVMIYPSSEAASAYEGLVTRVGINGSANSGFTTYPVTVNIGEIGDLLPGMNVNAEILLETAENVMIIPNPAVVRGNMVLVTVDSPSAAGGSPEGAPEGYVYVPVEVGISDQDNVEIKSGLVEGDTVGYEQIQNYDDMYYGGGMF